MDDPIYLMKKFGMRRSLNPFSRSRYVLHICMTLAHQERLYALSRETGKPIGEMLPIILNLGLLCEKDAKGRTDMVYYDPDIDRNEFYHALLVKGFAAYDAGKR